MVEIGVDDLAMDVVEARALVEAAGADLGDAELADLVRTTEGWPVGLYLAALVAQAGAGLDGDVTSNLTGDDRLVADYLHARNCCPTCPSARSTSSSARRCSNGSRAGSATP